MNNLPVANGLKLPSPLPGPAICTAPNQYSVCSVPMHLGNFGQSDGYNSLPSDVYLTLTQSEPPYALCPVQSDPMMPSGSPSFPLDFDYNAYTMPLTQHTHMEKQLDEHLVYVPGAISQLDELDELLEILPQFQTSFDSSYSHPMSSPPLNAQYQLPGSNPPRLQDNTQYSNMDNCVPVGLTQNTESERLSIIGGVRQDPSATETPPQQRSCATQTDRLATGQNPSITSPKKAKKPPKCQHDHEKLKHQGDDKQAPVPRPLKRKGIAEPAQDFYKPPSKKPNRLGGDRDRISLTDPEHDMKEEPDHKSEKRDMCELKDPSKEELMMKLRDLNKNVPNKAALKLMDMLFSDQEMATHLYRRRKRSSRDKPYLSDTHGQKVERLEACLKEHYGQEKFEECESKIIESCNQKCRDKANKK